MAQERRVAITGIGVMGIGTHSVAELWSLLCDVDAEPTGGPDPTFDPSTYLARREHRRMDRFSQLAVAAALTAWEDAGRPAADPQRTGAIVASTYGGMGMAEEGAVACAGEGPGAVSPLFGNAVHVGAAAVEVARRVGAGGPAYAVSATCASGTLAVGEAARLITSGRCEVAFAGGSESAASPAIAASFENLKILAAGRPRPFDLARDGFAYAEGAAILVLESIEHAARRGARVYGEVAGDALLTDLSGAFAPSDEARVVEAGMRRALAEAVVDVTSVAAVNAHGTGTRSNDEAEAIAVARLWGDAVPVTANKGALGHRGSAAGTFEIAAALLSMRHGLLPPTAGLEHLDPSFAIDVVQGAPRPWAPGPVVKNSMGLGGFTASLVLVPPR